MLPNFGIFYSEGGEAVFVQKWSHYIGSIETPLVKGLYAQEKNTVDVLAFGSSHIEYGLNGMKVYEDLGISCYSGATSAQPVEMSYYFLKNAFKRQSPKLVILDIGMLFEGVNYNLTRILIDSIPYLNDKIEIAKWYGDNFSNVKNAEFGTLFPLYKYHSRWNELNIVDFNFMKNSVRDFYAKGFWFCSMIRTAPNVTEMNNTAENFIRERKAVVKNYKIVVNEQCYDNLRYNPS
ncbi:MAG: hypothetical protein IJ597_03870, partial [Synergistaceae bacterium]|nr:hypothetical protein [Synergistaceae bacterium]